MGFIDFLSLEVIFGYSWTLWAVFGPPLSPRELDVYIYPLAIAPAKKDTLSFEFFSFVFTLFVVWLLEVDFSPGWAHFGPLLGAKILQGMTYQA